MLRLILVSVVLGVDECRGRDDEFDNDEVGGGGGDMLSSSTSTMRTMGET